MIYVPTIVALLFAAISAAGSVQAEEYPPTRGTLVGKMDGDLLDYECSSVSADRISCSFVQVLLSSKSSEADLENSLAEAQALLDELGKDKEFCDFLDAYYKMLNGEQVEDAELRSKVAPALEEREKKGAENPELQKDSEVVMLSVLDVCRKPTIENVRAFIVATHKIDSQTCQPLFNRYTQEFVRVDKGLWVVESSPSGECGIVNTSRFLEDPKYETLWNYEASKIITNKSGGNLIQCKDLNELPQPYNWNEGPVLKNCKYVD